jgi:hypothetical protein
MGCFSTRYHLTVYVLVYVNSAKACHIEFEYFDAVKYLCRDKRDTCLR